MLRIVFMSFYRFTPCFMIPVIEYDLKIIVLCDNQEVLITLSEFLIGEDIAVREEKHGLISFRKQPLHR